MGWGSLHMQEALSWICVVSLSNMTFIVLIIYFIHIFFYTLPHYLHLHVYWRPSYSLSKFNKSLHLHKYGIEWPSVTLVLTIFSPWQEARQPSPFVSGRFVGEVSGKWRGGERTLVTAHKVIPVAYADFELAIAFVSQGRMTHICSVEGMFKIKLMEYFKTSTTENLVNC